MKKSLLLLPLVIVTTLVWAQPPPPPPPPPLPPGTAAPIDTDILYFIIPAALFAVYRLNKTKPKVSLR